MDYTTQELGPESLSENAAMESEWESGNQEGSGYDRPYRQAKRGCGCGCGSCQQDGRRRNRAWTGYADELEYEWEGAPQPRPPALRPLGCRPPNIPTQAAAPATAVPTAGKVQCPDPAFGVANPLGVIRAAVKRALEMLNNTIGELRDARVRVCRGERDVLRAVTAHFLRDRLSVCINDKRVWTAGSYDKINSVAEVIRRLVRVNNEIATNQIRYLCNGPFCDNQTGAYVPGLTIDPATGRVNCPKGAPREDVVLCQSFFQSSLDDQAQMIIHEVSHLTHCTEDLRGSTIGVAYCLASFVAATNGVRVSCFWLQNCPCRAFCPGGGPDSAACQRATDECRTTPTTLLTASPNHPSRRQLWA